MIREVETKRGIYEVVDDIHGMAVAICIYDSNDVFEFDEPSANLTDEEIVERINDCL